MRDLQVRAGAAVAALALRAQIIREAHGLPVAVHDDEGAQRRTESYED